MKPKVILFMLPLLLFSLIGIGASLKATDSRDITAHEWGTFTSIAGVNGDPVAWRSYGGTSDLPCFVERFSGFKGGLLSTVRMETPVLYFYGAQKTSAHVKVLFPQGTITEWYPKAATNARYDSIEWSDVAITPGAAPDFPAGGSSHYFAARETDANPLTVGGQKEKFLFYRGAGTFPLPLSAKVAGDGEVVVKNLGPDPMPGLILFENRVGHRRFRLVGSLRGETTLDMQSLQSDGPALQADFERVLVNEGLYPREARAMIETWRDSWFEEGARLFYIVPRRLIDSVLPLEIQPAPSQLTRVFVGRMEIITPAIQADVRDAIARNDRQALAKFGRFLEPIAQRLGVQNALVNSVYELSLANALNCAK